MSGTLQVDTITNQAGTGAPNFPYGLSGTMPTVQTFTSPGSGTYNRPTLAPLYIRVKMIGGGGGGAGGGTTGYAAGGAGGNTEFGTAVAGGGGGGVVFGGVGQASAAGGTNTVFGAGSTLIINQIGSGGGSGTTANLGPFQGGTGPFGGAGGGAQSGAPNSGSGGGGGGGTTSGASAGGSGASGGYLEFFINNPSSSYGLAIGGEGSAGGGGTDGSNGGSGGSGYIIVEEYYS